MEPKELAKSIARVLDDKKALDIRVLGVTDLTVLADYFIIATGTSSTHLNTLSGEVEMRLKEAGELPLHTEGHMSGNWLLIDYGSVIVHLFLKDTRAFYSIERLWSDAKVYGEGSFDEI